MEDIILQGSSKNITFFVNHPKIKSLFIQINEDAIGVPIAQIKFAIDVGQTNAWYLITQVNPLKVFGGSAGTYVHIPEGMMEAEEELIKTVLSWTPNKIFQMANNSKLIKDYSDFLK